MIIDVTKDFKHHFEEYQKTLSSQSNANENKQSIKKEEKFIMKIPFQYQLALKYAQDVYISLSKIQQILSQKKDNYFSNAAYSLSSFTNQQRNQFDQQTKQALKICSDQIDQLDQSAKRLSQQKSKKINLSYIGNLKQIILCLHQYFKNQQKQFAEFLKYNQIKKRKILNTLSIEPERIHKKQKEKEMKYFQKKNHNDNNNDNNIQFDNSNSKAELQQQAHLFYLEKVQEQKKTIETKQAIQSISQMLEEMSKKVLDQELLTSSFEDIGSLGLNFIQEGNKNLVQANNLSKQSGKYWILLFLSLAFSLLVLDFLKS